jgi:hypothetical protein
MEKINYDNALTKLYESLEPVENRERIDEGAWENIKYGLSKLGRYKAGGKIFGKGKVTKDAENKIRAILAKETNKLLRELDAEVRRVAPEFPNDKKRFTFLKGIITIGAFYDSIVAATKKTPEEEGFLPIDAANEIINDLREIVKKYLDVDLAGVYTTMESEEERDNILTEEEIEILKWDILTEEEKELLDEKGILKSIGGAIGKGLGAVKAAKDRMFDKAFGAEKGSDKPAKGGSGQSAKFQKSSGSGEFETKRMGKEGLESNRLPLLLNMVGGAMGAYSWLANTEWFKSLFTEEITYTDTEQVTEIVEQKTEVLNGIKNGEGVYVGLSRVTGIPVDANSDPQQFIAQLEQIGGGDAHKGVDLLCQNGGWMMRPGDAAPGLHDLVNNPDKYDNMGQFFKAGASGTGKLVDPDSGLDTTLYGTKSGTFLKSIIVKQVPVLVTKFVTRTAVKTGAAYYTAKGLGNILGPLGLGLVLAGITVKVLREKGQRQSRAKTLDDLLQSLKNIKPTEENIPVIYNLDDDDNVESNKDGEPVKKENNNLCSKNVDDLNQLLSGVKSRASVLRKMKLMDYSSNTMFQKTLLDNFLNSKVTSIKINGKPISETLRQLYDNGLLEAPLRSRDINKKQQLPSGWENQMTAFFSDLFKLFVLLNKSCKNNPTYNQIKKLFKQLYIISREGKGSYSDDKKRSELFKKLIGSLQNFFSTMSKTPNFVKGKEGKPSDEEIEKRRAAKEKGKQRMTKNIDNNVKPELAHYNPGDNVLIEELKRINQLMK